MTSLNDIFVVHLYMMCWRLQDYWQMRFTLKWVLG